MTDNAFWRRREIERMLLTGKKLTVSELMKLYSVSRTVIHRDLDIIGEELPVMSKIGYGGGFYLMEGPGRHQNALTHEQLNCLKQLFVICAEEQKEIILSIIREFGPYILGRQ